MTDKISSSWTNADDAIVENAIRRGASRRDLLQMLMAGGLAASASSLVLARALDARGCHFIHVSSGGLHPAQQIAIGPGYQLHFAAAIKREVAMPVVAVGLITEPAQAEAVLADGQADAVALARALLWDPRWPWHAAAALGAQAAASPQYLRGAPHGASRVLVPATGSAG